MIKSTCCIIGDDSLLIQCALLLMKEGSTVEAIISNTPNIHLWAKKQSIPIYRTSKLLLEADDHPSFDYVFTIAHDSIFQYLFEWARLGVINCYNALLPTYSNIASPTWAIVDDHKQYGITWHLVQQDGLFHILKQSKFELEKQYTALNVNMSCYEHAIAAFKVLIPELLTGHLDVQATKKVRVLNRGLACCGFINWETLSAIDIERMSRALTFGHYDNSIGTLKIDLGMQYAIVVGVEKEPGGKNQQPGLILAVDDNTVKVAARDGVVKIRKIIDKDGFEMSLNYFKERQNTILTCAKLFEYRAVESQYKGSLESEIYWLQKIRNNSSHQLFPMIDLHEPKRFIRLEQSINLSQSFSQLSPWLKNKSPTNIKYLVLLSAISIYFYRLNHYETVGVDCILPDKRRLNTNVIFSKRRPLNVILNESSTLKGVVLMLEDEFDDIASKESYITDLIARYTTLDKNEVKRDIIIDLSGQALINIASQDVALYFQLDTSKNKVNVFYRFQETFQNQIYKTVMSNLVEHITNIIDCVVTKQDLKVTEFSFLSAREKSLLCQWSQGKTVDISPLSIIDILKHQVRERPNKPAITMDGQTLTYLKLWKKINLITELVVDLQLPKGALIGVYLSRSIDMIAVILGVLKSGHAYVPIDIRYPLVKIDHIANTTQFTLLFTQSNLAEKITNHFSVCYRKMHIISVDQISSHKEDMWLNPEKNEANNQYEPTAYVMFTSGTTGAPKGVVVSQHNVLNYCRWFSSTTSLDEHSSIDFSSSIAFDLSVPCTIAPLLVGGRIVICSEATKANALAYLAYLKLNRITHVETTPGYMEIMLHYPDAVQSLASLKYVLLGADIVSTADVLKWTSLCPHQQIVNEYGPTEATVSATSYFVDKNHLQFGDSIPIGRPAYNSFCYIFDKHNNLCPLGIKGDLCIGGAQIASGYLNQPEITKEKFITIEVFNSEERLYKTGDLVCWLRDGNLQFFGRNDSQIKIHGYRVELTAIEATLIKLPWVQQAIVVAIDDESKRKYLRAYLVTEEKNKTLNDVRAFLLSHLAPYMVPKEFWLIDFVPLKENEKIDFQALSHQMHVMLTLDHGTSEHEENNTFETKVTTVWEHIFNRHPINIDDNFFEMGGDSLMALQIISELRSLYNFDIPLSYIIEHPNISSLSKAIEKFSYGNTGALVGNRTLIQLSSGVHQSPLFLVHPIGGSIFWFKQLATYFENDCTVYGIQDANLDGANIQFKTLEEMAAYYIQEMKTVYSGNRFLIGGASFGATVAFEIAHQLLKDGYQVDFLGLFDGWASYSQEIMDTDSHMFLQHKEQSQYTIDDRLLKLERYRKELLAQYHVPSLKSDVTLFKAKQLWPLFENMNEKLNGWRPYVEGHIDLHCVPGDHETMFFEPHIQSLVGLIKQKIKRVNDEA
ncbi:MAG: amino acid adenylation domain-containing protein [Legionellaceae bacterium]|nr:amino acid adenylation domain-containing protein [Legionellaceae bacterium]